MEENNQAKNSNPLSWKQKNIREKKNFKDLENKEQKTQIAGTINETSLQSQQSFQYQEDNKKKYK
jgi:hypothetical protein